MKDNIFTHIPTSSALLAKIRAEIPSYLTEKRLIHTLSVEKQALELANIYFPILGTDVKYLNDVSASALLHDMTKKLSDDEQDRLCEKYGIETDYTQKGSGALLHSKTAACRARELYGINDAVFGAVYFHTTGCENMNILEKLIFFADFIEPTRAHEVCKNARKDFYEQLSKNEDKLFVLDKAIISSIDSTILHLCEEHKPIDVETIKARNYLTAQYEK